MTFSESTKHQFKLDAAEEMYEALRDVLSWAGKDKHRMARRGWTIEKEMASLNKAAEALAKAEGKQP